MSAEEMMRTMTGSMDKLTPNSTNIIRVFFSSTFTDMKEERNLLMRGAVPYLKSYCQDKGFDLEVVDMRWGVREDAATEHAISEICLRAVENCQTYSEGPNFVLFLGNKYGFRPLPSAIPVTEFRLFRRLAYWMELNFETIEKWYLLDTNAVPPEYRILPITTLLPFYNNMNPVNKSRMLVHRANWDSDERNIQNVFRKVALMALEQGKITAEQCDRYFISLTESEVAKGILNYGQVEDHVLCFTRSLLQIDTNDPVARRFIDMTKDNEIDQDAQDLLNKLTNVKIPKAVTSNQIIENSINWGPNGINPEDDIHQRYLEMFSEWFKTLLKEQIDKAIDRCNEAKIKNDMHAEVTRHLSTAACKVECCFGQDELINEIFRLMQKKANDTNEEILISEEVNNETSDENNNKEENKLEKSPEETEEKIEDSGFNPVKVENDNDLKEDKFDEQKDEVKEQKEDENPSPEEAEEKAKDMMKPENILQHLESLGQNIPTVGYGLVGYNKSCDPEINIRDELVNFTATEDFKYPVVVYGEMGSGKSVTMASVAKLIKKWEPNAVVVIRFLGTTLHAKTIRNVIISIIKTIWFAYKLSPADLDLTSDIIYLGQFLQALIWQVSTSDHPLYILLDALDQLLPLEQAHSLAWLPTILPPHGSLLVSTLPHHNSILDSARRVLPQSKNFVEVLPFGETAAVKIISAISNSKSRSIVRPQRNFLIERFRECPTPLYLKLITDQALKWRSHQVVKDLLLGSNVVHAINHLLMNMEKTHGITFVSRAFGYLTSMKQGATFSEIEHLLTLDNEVLQDTYIFHLPPDSNHIRFPGSMWSSLWQDAKEYLITEGTHGNVILSWDHRAFQEACTERYLTEESNKKIHRFAAKFFMGYWHNKFKPLKLFKNEIGWYPENDRQVPAQPLYFKDGRLNHRKVMELPHHLCEAGMWREFHKEVVCNIDFLVAKAHAFGIVELRADLMEFLKLRYEFTDEIDKEDVDDPPSEKDEEEKDEEGEVKNKEEEKADGDEEPKDETVKVDEELFLTENKKQEETVPESNEKTQTTSSPVEEIKENSCLLELETVLQDVEILIEIFNIGMEAIHHSGFNLPSQIICQLGKQKAPTPSLQKLVEDCFELLEEHQKPMLKPGDACMATPGGMLQTSININMFVEDADRKDDLPFQFIAEDFYLHAIEQSSQKGDTLVVLDMAQGGEKVMMVDPKTYVRSIQFNKNGRFIMMCCYKECTKYNPLFYYKLYEGKQLTAYHLEKEALSMDVSSEGDIVAYADDRCCFICSPKREDLSLEVIYRLHHTESITNLKFSQDTYYLLTFNKGDGFKVWVPRRGEATMGIDSKKNAVQNLSGAVVHITKNHRLLQVLSEFGKSSTVVMYNLSSGEIIYELNSPELNEGIHIMETDRDEEYLIVATQSTAVGKKSAKSALLWDIETGKLISHVFSTEPFVSIKVLVQENTIYVIAAHLNKSSIEIYSVGLTHRPLAGAKLIRTIQGHSHSILQLSIIIPEGSGGGQRLVSAGNDNTVKFWDLQQVLTPKPKQTKRDRGKSTRLAYSKDGGSVFYGTEKGFVEQMILSNGEIKTISCDLEHPVNHLLVSRNGKLLIASTKNMVYVYYFETGELEFTLESCYPSNISCMAESNNVLVAGHSGMEGKGRIWDLSNGRVINDVNFLYSFYQTAVNPSGTQLGVTMFEYPIMVNVFSPNESEGSVQMQQVDTLMAACSHLEFSPNGKMLASSSKDGRLRIIDAETGRYLHTMVQPSSIPTFIFSWDSRLVVTAGFKSVYVWNIGDDHPDEEKGQLKVKLSRHGDYVTSLNLVLDSRFLVTGSMDKTIAIWSMKNKTAICSFRAHCPIASMVVASDLSSISFIPEKPANVAVLTLNKAAKDYLKEIPDKPVPPTVKKAQSVALTFSSQEVTQKTSVACSIL